MEKIFIFGFYCQHISLQVSTIYNKPVFTPKLAKEKACLLQKICVLKT